MNLYLEKFPNKGSYKVINIRRYMYPFLFLTVLFINLQATCTQLGQERERGIKDALGLKGMRASAFWSHWLVSEGAIMMLSSLVVTVAARMIGVIEHVSALTACMRGSEPCRPC